MKKYLKNTALIIAAMLLIILLRLSLDQWQGYSRGMEGLNHGDYKAAIMHFDRVINAHIPFSPLEEKAKRHLVKLGGGFESRGDLELALVCYETVRTSRYLARHFWVPDMDEIRVLNRRIASIKATLLVKDGMVKDFKEGYEQQMGIMNKDFAPSVFWSLVVVTSFWAYIGFIVLWILKRREVFIAAFSAAFVLWAVGLYLA
ncbi:MAG: hypothetical protein WC291_03535 [Thermodesulfovibrionales bacterium]